jgi:dsDNA-specific endonuclease/ATPase MutS2
LIKYEHSLWDTYFDGGKRAIKESGPSSEYLTVLRRLDETAQAMELLRFGEPSFLSRVKLIDGLLAKAKVSSLLSPQELLEVSFLLAASRLAKKMTDDNII